MQSGSCAWLALLEHDLAEIKELMDPPYEFNEETDEVAAIVSSDEIKRVFTLSLKREEASLRLILDARYEKDADRKREMLREVARLLQEKTVLWELFWLLVKTEYPEMWDWAGGHSSVRSGWRVVRIKKQSSGIQFFPFPGMQ